MDQGSHATPGKPVILLVNPEDDSRRYWRESLETHLKNSGIEAEIVEAGTHRRDGSYMDAARKLKGLVEKGTPPALIITDHVLGDLCYGTHITRELRRGVFLDDQDNRWPAGRTIPAAVVSGGFIHNGILFGDPHTLCAASTCLHDELNMSNYNGPERPIIDRFKAFIGKALAPSRGQGRG